MKKNVKLNVKSQAVKQANKKMSKRGNSANHIDQDRDLRKESKNSKRRNNNEIKLAQNVELAKAVNDEKPEAKPPIGEEQATRASEQNERKEESKRSLSSQSANEKQKLFQEHCDKSKNLKGNGRSLGSDSIVSLTLPSGLPAKLLLRALEEESSQYDVLTTQHIAVSPQQHQSIDVFIDNLQLDKIVQLVKELDALVGTFTARS